MATTALFTLTAAILITTSSAFVVLSVGKCPDVPIQADFDLVRYLGKWYSYENFDAPFQFGFTCVGAEYSLKDSGNIRVINTGYREFKIFNHVISKMPVVIEGEATIVNASRPAGLKVQFGNQPDLNQGQPNYRIVSTDYDTYSVVYSCSQPTIIPIKIELAWILTRERGIAPDALSALEYNLRQYGIDTSNFKLVDQSNC